MAIVEAGQQSGVYDSPVTVAILRRAWLVAHPTFVMTNAAHALCVVTLLAIALDARFQKDVSGALNGPHRYLHNLY